MLATASPAGPGESRGGLRWSLTLQSAGQQRRLGFPSLEHKNPDFGTWRDADSIPRRTTYVTHHRKPSMTSHSLHQQKSTTSASKPATHCRNQTTFNPSVTRFPPGATHLPLGATHLLSAQPLWCHPPVCIEVPKELRSLIYKNEKSPPRQNGATH